MNNAQQLTGFARLREMFDRRCTRDEILGAMIAYGWSSQEAEYAYAMWQLETAR